MAEVVSNLLLKIVRKVLNFYTYFIDENQSGKKAYLFTQMDISETILFTNYFPI